MKIAYVPALVIVLCTVTLNVGHAAACTFACQDIIQPANSKELEDLGAQPILFDGVAQLIYSCGPTSGNNCSALFKVIRAWRGVQTDYVLVHWNECNGPFQTGHQYIVGGVSSSVSRTDVKWTSCTEKESTRANLESSIQKQNLRPLRLEAMTPEERERLASSQNVAEIGGFPVVNMALAFLVYAGIIVVPPLLILGLLRYLFGITKT